MSTKKPAPQKTVIKKIKPYPFPANIGQNGVKKPVEVAFISVQGLIAKLGVNFVSVGDYYDFEAELPHIKKFVLCRSRVLKTYDKTLDIKEHKVERLAEFHFEKLTEDHKANIQEFMRLIGQKTIRV